MSKRDRFENICSAGFDVHFLCHACHGERDLYGNGNRCTDVDILSRGREPRRHDLDVIWIQREVRKSKCAHAVGGRRLLITAYRVADLDRRTGYDSACRINDGSFDGSARDRLSRGRSCKRRKQ